MSRLAAGTSVRPVPDRWPGKRKGLTPGVGVSPCCSGEDGIRTRGRVLPRHRFSKPALSATQPPLRSFSEMLVTTNSLLPVSFALLPPTLRTEVICPLRPLSPRGDATFSLRMEVAMPDCTRRRHRRKDADRPKNPILNPLHSPPVRRLAEENSRRNSLLRRDNQSRSRG